MNLAEKLAATYLRLNGFFLLPHFTVFSGEQHNHMDLIALRAAGSKECVDAFTFPVDNTLFDTLTKLRGASAYTSHVGIAAQVRTNVNRIAPTDAHVAYVRNFMGGLPVSRLAFYDGEHKIELNGNTLDIGMRHVGIWILDRIDSMVAADLKLNKVKSWNWSESFLSDLLALREYGLITDKRIV